MKKEIVKNRENKNIVVLIEEAESPKGLVFVVHGLGGFKEQPHIETISKVFKDNNFTVIRFDATNSTGESGGRLEDATMTNYYQDLEDVIKWSESKDWYKEPFWLAGHSVGGFCVAFFTLNHPEKTKAVAPISAVVSGELFTQTEEMSPILDSWRATGLREWESSTQPGLIKRLKYDFIEDCLSYNLLSNAHNIKCPVLLIVGESDITTPPEHQKKFFDTLKANKEFHIIKGAKHTFKTEDSLKELKAIIGEWIKK